MWMEALMVGLVSFEKKHMRHKSPPYLQCVDGHLSGNQKEGFHQELNFPAP